MTKKDLTTYLDTLFTQASVASVEGEIPVAACLVLPDGKAIYSHNRVEKENNPYAHAEFNVIQQAMKEQNTRYLKDSVLIVTLEPCLFCMGAILKAGIENVYYIMDDEKLGALNHYHAFVDDRLKIHQIEDERFSLLMDSFFKKIRKD